MSAISPGTRVKIIGDHPHAGKSGVYLGDRPTMFGVKPEVLADDGDRFFVMDPAEWRPAQPRPDACDRCEGKMTHTRLKGYRCPRCD